MAIESVATSHSARVEPVGTQCDLFLSDEQVLSVYVTKHTCAFPPHTNQLQKLHSMIRSLCRASTEITRKAVDETMGAELWLNAVCDIGDAITLLTQLADAVAEELNVYR